MLGKCRFNLLHPSGPGVDRSDKQFFSLRCRTGARIFAEYGVLAYGRNCRQGVDAHEFGPQCHQLSSFNSGRMVE